MNPSGYNIKELVQEAQTRWLKPAEVLFILQSHDINQITNEPPQRPPSGSLFLFNKRVLRFFRKDGHSWRRKKDGKTVGEAHERLKVGNVEAINCYYAHGEHNPNFQRRSYWMLDSAHDHIVLVHYRDITESRQNAGVMLQSSPVSVTYSASPSSYSNQPTGSSLAIGESNEQYLSPGSVEITSHAAMRSDGVNHSDNSPTEEVNSSASLEMNQALRKLEEQLSLDDKKFQQFEAWASDDEDLNNFGPLVSDPISPHVTQLNPNDHQSWQTTDGNIQNHQLLNHGANLWGGVLDTYGTSQNVGIHPKHVHPSDVNGEQHTLSRNQDVDEFRDYTFLDFGGKNAQNPTPVSQDVEGFVYDPYPPNISSYHSDPNDYAAFFDRNQNRDPLEDGLSLTISQKQKFSIQEISPEWGYASETTKVIIVGSFLCDPSETVWTCMLGDIEVPVQMVRDGVMRCLVPPHLPGKVTLCITSSNRESCSEVREFEYRINHMNSAPSSMPEADFRSPEELLLLVRFVQTILSNSQMPRGDNSDPRVSLLSKARSDDDSWGQVIEALLFGTWTPGTTTNWLLQELLKDKFEQWLYSRPQEVNPELACSLSRKEQGIIHLIAGLGFEWAMHPILNSGVSINFRDINGWTALHWAARFGREKMVAELMASGASPGAVTDPTSQDPVGKTPASIASTYGHHGLAGYLSEVALTSHLLSLTLKESELSKGSADLEAERTVSSIAKTASSTSEDQLSLKQGLAAVRSAAQAAARIQSAFRAHSFRKRRVKGSFTFADGDEYDVLSNDIEGLSAASKLAFRNGRDYSSAAVSIQKKYRGYKGRKDFLSFRQKVVKIQAHVRGYQVRKQYKVCWATGILEKVVLRWRRRGVGLRGYRHEAESIDETEDEDILKVFRKQKVDAAIDEAVSRVLLMVECPDARQQYRRILEKYRQAKAELEGVPENQSTDTPNDDLDYMENK